MAQETENSSENSKSSMIQIPAAWYVAMRSRALKNSPQGRTILGIPMVFFRNAQGEAKGFLNRCPHRNVQLSSGRVAEAKLQCRYHGWTFNAEGQCTNIPGFCGEPNTEARRLPPFSVVEQDGYIWVFPEKGAEPKTRPEPFQELHQTGYHSLFFDYRVKGSLHATLENILDVPHTAFIHKGLFRSSSNRQEIQAIVRRQEDRVEVEFLGEARPTGLIGRLLSPSGGLIQHHDRFRLPATAEVEYRLGTENHLLARNYLTPISEFETQVHLSLAARIRIPAFLVRFVAKRLAMRLIKQDQSILQEQSENIQRMGGESYLSTDLDVLGPQILQILKQAERGQLKVPVDLEDKTIVMKL